MIRFDIPDMTCSHCEASVRAALRRVDAGAQVEVDLPAHRVSIEPAVADAGMLERALREAGYTPALQQA